MRLIACPTCHAQYDLEGLDATALGAAKLSCRCGETLRVAAAKASDAAIHRCASCGAGVASEAPSCAFCGSEIVRDLRKRSLICPECYARCVDDARFCTACGVAFRPEPLPGSQQVPACPVCAVAMNPQPVAGLALAECPSCHGLWVPAPHFDTLMARALEARRQQAAGVSPGAPPRVSGANPARQGVRYLRCPACDEPMARRNFRKSSGVIIDCCRHCGTWLDSDELEAIAGFLLEGGETSAVIREEAARTEAERIRILNRARMQAGISSEGAGAGSLAALFSSLFD